MSKIELPNVISGYNLSTINNNFQKIEDTLNKEVLYRKGYLGEPNEMQTNLDMNGKQILNVTTGTSDGSLVTKYYVDQGLSLKFDKSGGPLSGSVDMQNNQINNLPNATQPSQPATYAQLLQVEAPGDSLLRNELAAPGGAGLVATADGRTVQERFDDIPAEVDAAGTAAALISQHNSSSAAHPELSAFISAEANRAEAARDAAFVNANVYPDVATGRAAVADGEQFQVVAGDEVVRYRRDSASTQTEVARYPSTKYVADGKVGVFDRISPNLHDLYRYSDLTELERKAFKVIRRLDITGSDELFRITLVISGGQITTFRLTNADITIFINMLSVNVGSLNVFDRVYHFEASAPLPNGNIVKVSALLDIRDSPDFIYDSALYFTGRSTGDKQFPHRYVGKFPTAIQNSFVSVGFDELRVKLTPDTMFMRFYVSEPTVLGSVVLFAENVPSVQPAYVECAIYKPDGGSGTTPIFAQSGSHQITKAGIMRLPLENKVLQPGNYAIGFKTNALDCFTTVQGVYANRAYDGPGKIKQTSINLNDPGTRYARFPSFHLCEMKDAVAPRKPANWEVRYEPEYNFVGQGVSNVNLYLRAEGSAGSRTLRFYKSTDGGITKTALHNNDLDETQYAALGEVLHAVVHYPGDIPTLYYATMKGMVVKVQISAGVATLTDITPPNKSASLSAMPVNSYAPLVMWKGFLFWGEYQDPDRPRIHKMDLDTGIWYTSIEKPRSGPNGARHVHFLYPSPVNPNVLWAVWGDASNGGGQGINRLEITASKASVGPDPWQQWTTGLHDENKTTLPYPTGLLEIWEGNTGLIGKNESILIGAGDQPPTHLVFCKTDSGTAGNHLIQPLNFKRETAPNTETCHWLAIDEHKTIYYMSLESRPQMSFYASPYPYNRTYRISKFWQQVFAGPIAYSNGYIQTRNYRFPSIQFKNHLDVTDISKVPYVGEATSENIVERFNQLLDNLRGSNILQHSRERGNDKDGSFWPGDDGKFENWN